MVASFAHSCTLTIDDYDYGTIHGLCASSHASAIG